MVLYSYFAREERNIISRGVIDISQNPHWWWTITTVLAPPTREYSDEDGLIMLWAVARS